MERGTGEAAGGLYYPSVGDIDLIWGSAKGGYGLAKIAERHPEVLKDLQGILDKLTEVRRSDQTVFLENPQHTALVRLNWMGKEKTWLLTAFEKRGDVPSAERTIDVPGTHAEGRQAPHLGGTAPPLAGRTMDIPGTPQGARRDDTAPPPSGGSASSIEPIGGAVNNPQSDEDPTLQSRTGAYQPGHDATGALRVAMERCGS